MLNVTTTLLCCFSLLLLFTRKVKLLDMMDLLNSKVRTQTHKCAVFFCFFLFFLEINFITKSKNNQRNKYFCQCFSFVCSCVLQVILSPCQSEQRGDQKTWVQSTIIYPHSLQQRDCWPWDTFKKDKKVCQCSEVSGQFSHSQPHYFNAKFFFITVSLSLCYLYSVMEHWYTT